LIDGSSNGRRGAAGVTAWTAPLGSNSTRLIAPHSGHGTLTVAKAP
jgi:hypothetical protein